MLLIGAGAGAVVDAFSADAATVGGGGAAAVVID